MRFQAEKNKRIRSKKGSAITEFGPAIWILIICIFLPMINMLALALDYGLCMVLNHNQVHEAALLPSFDANKPNGAVKKSVPDLWLSGMGKFARVSSYPSTKISYRSGQNIVGVSNASDKFVRVETTVVCNPILKIPVPVINVPGLNGPANFTIISERPMENPDYAS